MTLNSKSRNPSSRLLHAVALAAGMAMVLLANAPARAQDVPFRAHDVRSAFYVAKSQNQNQVHYGVRLDARCLPVDDAPVFAYWRRLGPEGRVDQPLEGLGVHVYGVSDEQDVRAGATGSTVVLHVKALDRLPITLEIAATDQGCTAVAYVLLSGERARLSYAFVQLGMWGLRPRYVEVVGFRERDGAEVRERFH